MKHTFQVVKQPSFRVIGKKITTTNRKHEGAKVIPQQWQIFFKSGKEDTLLSYMDEEPTGLFGNSVYNIDEFDPYKFDYYIAVPSDREESDSYISYMVPEATWAIFPCTKETIAKTEVKAITKWIPRSAYKACNSGYFTGRMKSSAPDLERYGKNGEVEVWIPVTTK